MSDRWVWGPNHVSDKYEVWRRCTQKTLATRGSARIKARYKVHGTKTSYEVWAYLWPSRSDFLPSWMPKVTLVTLILARCRKLLAKFEIHWKMPLKSRKKKKNFLFISIIVQFSMDIKYRAKKKVLLSRFLWNLQRCTKFVSVESVETDSHRFIIQGKILSSSEPSSSLCLQNCSYTNLFVIFFCIPLFPRLTFHSNVGYI